MITIQGKGVSAGVGVGPLYYYRRATAEIKRYTVEDTDAEWHRFKGAQTGRPAPRPATKPPCCLRPTR